jgi:hypothetical protein
MDANVRARDERVRELTEARAPLPAPAPSARTSAGVI